MPLEQRCCTRRAVLKWGLLALAGGASAGCEEDFALPRRRGAAVIVGIFHIVGDGMYDVFTRWRESLAPGDRNILEELIRQEDLLIHVFLATGRLSPLLSRGGKSGPASSKDMKRVCDFHPIVGQFAWGRNWDVVCDPEAAKVFEEKHGILNPPEVVLYHEIFGHVIPALKDPTLLDKRVNQGLKKADDCGALGVENRYRRQIGLREVPPKLIGCKSP